MKQKIVVKVSLSDQKSRSKALKIAVGISGVESAGLGGNDKSQIEVVGDGVDPVELATSLRKKIGYTELVSVSAVGEKKEEKKEDKKEEGKVQVQPVVWQYQYGGPQVLTVQDNPYYYPSNPNNTCSIM